jgi:hypothetical protein
MDYGGELKLAVTVSPPAIYSYQWSPPTSLSCADCPDPIARPLVTSTYRLLVTDLMSGCSDTATVTVMVRGGKRFYVPNAITPNGDGINDQMQVFYSGTVTYYQLQVFDRWGEKIYDSYNPTSGWDGTYCGSYVLPASYVYQLSLSFNDGQSFNTKGTVTVIR